jgi:hypothetical protein
MSLPSAPLTTPLKLYNKMHLVVQQGKQKCKKMKEEIVEEKKNNDLLRHLIFLFA